MSTNPDREELQPEILIVDDTPANLDLLTGMLKDRFRVRAAVSGRRALATAQSFPVDLVLLDVDMPEMNGYEVCRELKSAPATREIPVIFVSALDSAIDKVAAFEAGGADYVTKPFQVAEVMARIEHQLRLARLTRDLERKNEELGQAYGVLRSTAAELAESNRQLASANERLRALSYLDGLTGVANRRRFDEALAEAWEAASETAGAVSLLLIDLDLFKKLNDTHGHQEGDEALRAVATLLGSRAAARGGVAARFGGEEFVWLMPGTPLEEAVAQAELLRHELRASAIRNLGSERGILTASLGVASGIARADRSPGTLVSAADLALYRAKSAGRDRVEREAIE